MERTFFNWSSGKDSALALHRLLQDNRYKVGQLLTTVSAEHDRVSMHGLRRELLQRQAEAIGLPLTCVEVPSSPSNDQYENRMAQETAALKKAGYGTAAFGDIFLEDLRRYREENLAAVGIKTVFPLWKSDTAELMREFLALGFKAITVCVQNGLLNASFAGRLLDESFIADLPAAVDVCGENGEFHTFCFDGPVFKHPVAFTKGETVYREYKHGDVVTGFWFCDLLPSP